MRWHSLADLVERALMYVMDKDADFRARESGVADAGAKRQPRQVAKRVIPADKAGGAP
jgi:hypothetical protein